MAVRVAVDSKTQNVSVCNAMETLLVHGDVAEAFLPPLAPAMAAKGVELRGDEATPGVDRLRPAPPRRLGHGVSGPYPVHSRGGQPGGDHRPYQPPWLPPHGLHRDSDDAAAAEFLQRVDSAGVYWNASTRFADGLYMASALRWASPPASCTPADPWGWKGLPLINISCWVTAIRWRR